MGSMISHFGNVVRAEEDQPSSTFCWDGRVDLASNLTRLSCPITQLKVLLEQSLAAAYYLKIYGPRCHEVVNDYIEELNNDITYRFTRMCAHTFTDNFLKVYNTLLNLVKFNRGGNWSDVDIKLVQEFLFDGVTREGLPVVWKNPGCCVPFLMWMNRGVQPEYQEFANAECGVTSFRFDKDWEAGSASGMMTITADHNFIGKSFSAERTPLDSLTSCPLVGLLSHFDWSTRSFEYCVGTISSYCFHDDIERYGVSLSHHLAYCLKQGCMFPRFDISGANEGIEPVISKYHEQLFDVLLTFLGFCTQKRGMSLVDRTIVARAFGCIAYTKEQKESVNYLRQADATPSADELKSFRKVMGSVESLQLISQSPTLITAQASDPVAGSTEAAEPDKGEGENKTPGSKPEAGEADKAEKDKDASKTEEGKEGDDSKPTNDDDGADDTNSDDTFEAAPADDPGSNDANATPGESGDSSVENEPSTQTVDTPEEVNTSDDKGIEFEFAVPDSATVDSVLFREEMYKFLTNVLTNPPKCLSPQDVETLTALKRFWLSCLSIETIKGIVEACIRLPKSIKHSIHKSTELQK